MEQWWNDNYLGKTEETPRELCSNTYLFAPRIAYEVTQN
jgi:hypothetical protein